MKKLAKLRIQQQILLWLVAESVYNSRLIQFGLVSNPTQT